MFKIKYTYLKLQFIWKTVLFMLTITHMILVTLLCWDKWWSIYVARVSSV